MTRGAYPSRTFAHDGDRRAIGVWEIRVRHGPWLTRHFEDVIPTWLIVSSEDMAFLPVVPRQFMCQAEELKLHLQTRPRPAGSQTVRRLAGANEKGKRQDAMDEV